MAVAVDLVRPVAAAQGGGGASGGGAQAAARAAVLALVREEALCPICRGTMDQPAAVMHCLHRFCERCFQESHRRKKECPSCRANVKSRRSLRRDERFGALIAALGLYEGGMGAQDGAGSESDDEDVEAVLARARADAERRAQALKGEAKAKGAELRAKGWFDKGALTRRQPQPQTKRVRTTGQYMGRQQVSQQQAYAYEQYGGQQHDAQYYQQQGAAGDDAYGYYTAPAEPYSPHSLTAAARSLLEVAPDALAPPPGGTERFVQVKLEPADGDAADMRTPYLCAHWDASLAALCRWAQLQSCDDTTVLLTAAGEQLPQVATLGELAEQAAEHGGMLRLLYARGAAQPMQEDALLPALPQDALLPALPQDALLPALPQEVAPAVPVPAMQESGLDTLLAAEDAFLQQQNAGA